MTQRILDTDISSYVIRAHPSVIRSFRAIGSSHIFISAVTRAELLYGLKRVSAEHKLQEGVRMFLNNITVLPWPIEAAEPYAAIRHELTASGQPIGELDMMIAAHAISAGAVLVTNNKKHYSRIRQSLTLENWLP